MAPQKIVILRHGEKSGDADSPDTAAQPDLAPAGVKRADALVRVLPADFGRPDFLVAAASSNVSRRPSKRSNRWQIAWDSSPTGSFSRTQTMIFPHSPAIS